MEDEEKKKTQCFNVLNVLFYICTVFILVKVTFHKYFYLIFCIENKLSHCENTET